MEIITSGQPPPACRGKEKSSVVPGVDFSHMYQVYKPRRGMKRSDESKEIYKLPHRLIEKKRRDRINECIAQLKDLLPEHLKLTTLGHLEKAVVLELTLKHVKTLSNVLEQQQQKILTLQSGIQSGDLPARNLETNQEMFRSGFQMCVQEVLKYLAKQETEGCDVRPSQIISHLQRVASELLQGGSGRKQLETAPKLMDCKEKSCSLIRTAEGHGKNCVPVIQRTFAHSSGEQSGSDTDTDSGYGGEPEKSDSRQDTKLAYHMQERIGNIKLEHEEPPAKRSRLEPSRDDDDDDTHFSTNDLIGSSAGFLSSHPQQPPFCFPFYLIPPSATAYLPMLEKCWYPASVPMLYPGLPTSAAALSGLMNSEKVSPSLLMPQRLQSPVPAPSSMDSALLQALKQIPPLSLESKD
ncbi:class E basic helix-loop-helix protein 40 [Microcaecilia unicolor]|uniref:Class E basic helix-loop-helix protein 40 n=1 Tax=Microcaecilia unicolor TaxID=1415580 RepID=A0A6P7Y9P4_9AMPH|nr:class E basic helix-loop-helix protein 40 [Microcaecilia unicolor]